MKMFYFLFISAMHGLVLALIGQVIYRETLFDPFIEFAAGWVSWSFIIAVGYATILRPYFELMYERWENADNSGGGAI